MIVVRPTPAMMAMHEMRATPAVVTAETAMATPAAVVTILHLRRQAFIGRCIALHGRCDARAVQRHRACLLRRCGDKQQSRDCSESKNLFDVHMWSPQVGVHLNMPAAWIIAHDTTLGRDR